MTYEEAIAQLTFLHHIETDRKAYRLAESIEIAISALEKQIPKKPPKGHLCPNSDCGRILPFEITAFNIPHCWYCGQALDWSEDD